MVWKGLDPSSLLKAETFMITLIYGLPRSGKSYTAMEQYVLPALAAGRPVYSLGIPVRDARVKVITSADFVLSKLDGGALVVIDEAWRYFPSGQRQAKVDESTREFLALHGHRVGPKGEPFDIVMMCQSVDQLAGWVRGSDGKGGLVDQIVWITANRASGLILRRRRRWEGGSILGSPIEDSGFSINEDIAAMYSSTEGTATESATQGPTASVWRNKWVIAAALTVLIGGPLAAYGVSKAVNNLKGENAPVAKAGGTRQAQTFTNSARQPVSYVPPVAPDKPEWRVQAVIEMESGKGSIASLVNKDGVVATVPLHTCKRLADVNDEWACNFDGRWIWRGGEWSGLLSE